MIATRVIAGIYAATVVPYDLVRFSIFSLSDEESPFILSCRQSEGLKSDAAHSSHRFLFCPSQARSETSDYFYSTLSHNA